jgi:hypothetical protein
MLRKAGQVLGVVGAVPPVPPYPILLSNQVERQFAQGTKLGKADYIVLQQGAIG